MAVIVYEKPLDLPEGFYPPIGEIAARFSLTEYYVQCVIWHILGIENVKHGRALTWGINAVEKLKLFKALLTRWASNQSVKDDLLALYDDLEDMRAKRNHIVHGLWCNKPGHPDIIRLFTMHTTDTRVDPKSERYSAEGLRELADKLVKLNQRLKRLIEKHGVPTP